MEKPIKSLTIGKKVAGCKLHVAGYLQFATCHMQPVGDPNLKWILYKVPGSTSHSRALLALPQRRPFVDEGIHPLFLVSGGKKHVKEAAFQRQAG